MAVGLFTERFEIQDGENQKKGFFTGTSKMLHQESLETQIT